MLPRAEASSTDFIAAAASAEMVPPIAAFHVARLESSCARGTCAADVDRVCVRGARVGEASGEERVGDEAGRERGGEVARNVPSNRCQGRCRGAGSRGGQNLR